MLLVFNVLQMEVININKLLKRILCFILILTISSGVLLKKEEKPAHAIAGIDDLALGALIVTCAATVLGTYNYLTEKNGQGPIDAFIDAFGKDTFDSLIRYIKAVDINEASVEIRSVEIKSPELAEAAIKVKSQYKFPVELTPSGTYRTYDMNGNIVEYADQIDLLNNAHWGTWNTDDYRCYYMVESLDSCAFTVNTSGKAVIKKDVFDDVKKAISTLSRPYVNLGKTILDDIVDFVGAANSFTKNDMNSMCSIPAYEDIMSLYDGKTAIVYYNGYSQKNDYSEWSGIAINGLLFELRLQDGSRLYQTMSVDKFSTLNENYSKTGSISIFKNAMSSSLILGGSHYFYADCCSDMKYGAWNNDVYSLFKIEYYNGKTGFYHSTSRAFDDDCYPMYAHTSLDSGKFTIINNGLTANYVIGQEESDGSISYSVYGETTETPYIDGLSTGNTQVKVNGDVVVNQEILDQVKNNSATVEDINSELADVNSTVKVIDNSVNNGFNSVTGWLKKLWDAITGVPGAIISGIGNFFDTLFGWLSDILSAIFGVPVDIVAGLDDVEDAILDLPNDFVGTLSDIKDYMGTAIDDLTVLSPISVAIDVISGLLEETKDGVLDLPQAFTDAISGLGDIVLDLPSDFVGTVEDILDWVKNIPESIISLLKDLLIELFVPSDTYFNDWKDKFDNNLRNKLPYTTYNDFMNNVKDITSSRLNDITVNIYGKECTIVTFKWYYDHYDEINSLIRGVMFFVLIFFNINMMYKLIRGTSLYKIQKYT